MGARESLVQWDDSYSLGLEQIDDQHKVLFDIMNQLWSAIVRRAEGAEMQRILDELERYTVSHFSAEEAFMLSAGFAGVDEHRRQHAGFVERIRSARSDLRQGKEVSLELLHFLRDWLVQHIQAEDRAYAADYRKSRQVGGMLGRFFAQFRRA
ncbi:hemerythrin family protein [Thauera sp. CAU 1555]|uniref:Hemerythrin family protein n=1 Tax=Thauera sedimentorum TaxID=2767595 RepID=A0ABR9B6X2_9RHOO|nr:bacteriohemerythrin [Thauera sedimentorum]MBC9071201.1 hemerythrin family protein [Thauera sedimentorum]MBD8502120.1 hemerythrin family protein [Thauera sedimentorum]